MPRQPSPADDIIARLAERNVRINRVRDRMASVVATERQGPVAQPIGPFIAVTRLHGAGGDEVATRVGAALNWPVLDHEVVNLVASHLHIDPVAAEALDRNAATWMSDILSSLWPQTLVPRERYSQELRRALQLLAMDGEVVLMGHAAHLFLPREQGLAVRVVATEQDCVARICARSTLTEAQARREIEKIDGARALFVSRTFGRDVSDPLLYDLVLNSSALRTDILAELVASAWRLKESRSGMPALKAS